MRSRKKTKYVYEGQYVAQVEVDLLEDGTGWMPYLSASDAYKLDDVRAALRRRDLNAAASTVRFMSYVLLPCSLILSFLAKGKSVLGSSVDSFGIF